MDFQSPKYCLRVGIALVVVPNVLLEMFFLASTTEVWVRVVGMLVLFGVVDVLGVLWSALALRSPRTA